MLLNLLGFKFMLNFHGRSMLNIYIYNRVSKSVRIIPNAGKKLHEAALVTLYYPFVYPYFIYIVIVCKEIHIIAI